MEDDSIDKRLKKAAKELGDSLRVIADSVEESLRDIDWNEESVRFLKDTEKTLDSVGGAVRRKREEMERSGVKETIRKDGKRVGKLTEETALEFADDLERTAKEIKDRVRKKRS